MRRPYSVTDELQRKTGVRIVQLKNCPKIDVIRNFWLNSVYSWLCYRLQTLAEGCMAQKMGFAPCCTYKRSKNASKCPQNYHLGDLKIIFIWHSPLPWPLPRTPPRRRIAPPFWNPKYATAPMASSALQHWTASPTKEGCHWQAGGENRQTWQLANPAW